MNDTEVLRLLCDKERLRMEQVQVVASEKAKTGAPLGYLLIRFGILSADRWYSFVLRDLKIPSIDLSQMEISREVLNSLPEFTCKRYQVIPVHRGGGKLVCAMVDPSDEASVRELEKITGLKVEGRVARESDIRRAMPHICRSRHRLNIHF